MLLLLEHPFLLLSHPSSCYKSNTVLLRFRRHFATANPVGEYVSGVLVTPSGSLLYGHPPKFIYLRIGNSPTSEIVYILRDNFDTVCQFENSELESILVLE